MKSILFLLAHLTILPFRLSMGEGGSSGVAAFVNYDPSVTSPKIIAGETWSWKMSIRRSCHVGKGRKFWPSSNEKLGNPTSVIPNRQNETYQMRDLFLKQDSQISCSFWATHKICFNLMHWDWLRLMANPLLQKNLVTRVCVLFNLSESIASNTCEYVSVRLPQCWPGWDMSSAYQASSTNMWVETALTVSCLLR